MSLIPGVLLAGPFRTQHELGAMSAGDQRNTLIVELANRTNQPVGHFQGMDDATLAGAGAVLVFLRTARIRTDAQLKTMSDDDQRNTLIVEIDAQTGLGRALQGFSNINLVLQGLGQGQPSVSLVQPSYIRGVLLAGQFRTQHELNTMSPADQRNTLIVELTNRTNQPVAHFQGMNDFNLAGTGAVLVFLRRTQIRTDAQLKTMSDDGQRNTLIVEIGAQTGFGVRLQALSNIDLVRLGLGADVFVPNEIHGISSAGDGVFGESTRGIGVHGKGGRLAGFFEGDVEVTGDVRLRNADCAEDFDAVSVSSAEPGSVMVVGEEGILVPCGAAYDKRVVGVVSGAGGYRPAIALDRQPSMDNRVPIGLLGKVYCKVDAKYGRIEVGDLLTTSPTLGHAMKAEGEKAFGSVLGKALRPLRAGQGLIPVLIALQ